MNVFSSAQIMSYIDTLYYEIAFVLEITVKNYQRRKSLLDFCHSYFLTIRQNMSDFSFVLLFYVALVDFIKE